MAELISTVRHVLPDYVRLAILDSRLIPGKIEQNKLTISSEWIIKLRSKLSTDFFNLQNNDTIYLTVYSGFIIFDYNKSKNHTKYLVSFKNIWIFLFVKQYAQVIGLRRSVLLSNLLLEDNLDSFSKFVNIPKEKIEKFLNGYCELRDSLTINKIRDFYDYDIKIEKGILFLEHEE